MVAPPVVSFRNNFDGAFIPLGVSKDERKLSLGVLPAKDIDYEDSDPNAPPDRLNFVLITLFFLGFASLLPITFFLTANEYLMYKFRNVSEGDQIDAKHRTPLQMAYATYLLVLLITPSIFFNILFSFIGHKLAMNFRARSYYYILLGTFLLQFIFSLVNTDAWQTIFFAILVASQFALSFGLSLGMAILLIAKKFPKKYFLIHMIGQGLEGVLIAVIRLLSVAITESHRIAGIYYFGCGVFLMTLAIVMFEISLRTKFYQYYVTKVEKDDANKKANSIAEIVKVTKKVWKIAGLCILNVVSPAAGLDTLVVSQDHGTGSLWADTYFITVCSYLIPSIGNLIGRAFSQKWGDVFGIPVLYIISLGRMIIFTPLMFLCNVQPRHHFLIWLGQDWEYALLMFFGNASMGYLLNVTFIMVSKIDMPPEHSELAFRIVLTIMASAALLSAPMSIVAIGII